MKKAFLKYLKNKFVIAGLTVVALIALFVVYKSATKPPNFDSAEVKIGDVVETVSVTGTISPVDKADLAFEKSGVLARVYVKVGDAVKRGQTIAVLSGGNERAALSGAEATLADMSRALTPEEQAVQKSALDAASAALEIAKKDALNSAYGGYVKAGSALGNYTDGFFANPSSVNPTINLPTDSSNQESNINRERVAVTNELSKWSAEMSAATDSSAED
ncbi:MAG: biotin/lipoyl-binding protein, partial [Patescibacteria group bacterium]